MHNKKRHRRRTEPRIGLVLGAGGPVGHAFHAGVLHGLNEATGWDPRNATVIVGTSAGAQVAGLLRAGMKVSDLTARITGEGLSPEGKAMARHYTRPHHPPASLGLRLPIPASWEHFRQLLLSFLRTHPIAYLLAMLPEGKASMEEQAIGYRKMFGKKWPKQKLWICSVRLHDGRRVAFGRKGAPETDIGTAVIASGAVPGMCEPVLVGKHRYVDGGFRSLTNLDLLAGEDLDLVIVSSPMTCGSGPGPASVSRQIR